MEVRTYATAEEFLDDYQREAARTYVDVSFPPQGPCALCCQGDARHRVIDAIAERYAAGDTVKTLAADYDLPADAIITAVEFARAAAPSGKE